MFFRVKQYDILSTAAQHGAVKTLCGSRENSPRMCLHISQAHKVQKKSSFLGFYRCDQAYFWTSGSCR